MKKSLINLGRNLIIGIFFLILVMPVIFLPLVTSVPAYVWSVLLIFSVILIGLFFKIKPRKKALKLVTVGLVIVDIVAIASSQLFASTPKITGEDGKPLAGSIASLEQVTLNGSSQWITIRGKDVTKPILLYLGIGGPGAGGFPATFTSLKPLEDHFVVVNWDQPGTGKSYNSRPIRDLTRQMVVDDAYALTNLLRERFDQDKVYVMGLSWGTIVGIDLIQQHPDLFHAYVGTGQMVNTVENDRYGYDLATKLLQEQGDTRTHKQLTKNGPPPYTGSGLGLKFAAYNDVLFKHMGSPTIPFIIALVPQFAREYGYIDKINFGRGLFESFTVLYPQLNTLDFEKEAPKLDVPVYFLVGKKDVNAVYSIVERYYHALEAPHKELIWLESGHGATAEEIEQALVNHVLIKSNP